MSDKDKELFDISTLHGTFQTEFLTENYKRRKRWEPANPKEVKSHIPGTVLRYSVAPGDKVEVGDELLIFKAMKMDSIVTSEISGTIKATYAEAGVNVPKGKILLEFE